MSILFSNGKKEATGKIELRIISRISVTMLPIKERILLRNKIEEIRVSVVKLHAPRNFIK